MNFETVEKLATPGTGKTAKSLLSRIKNLYRTHPKKMMAGTVAGVGGAGMLAALPKARREGQRLEAEMAEAYTGAPGGKYVFAALEKFAERKQYLSEKIAMVKKAYNFAQPASNYPGRRERPSFAENVEGGVAKALGGGIAQAGISALGKLISGTAKSLKERMVLDKKREAIVDHIMEHDPIVSVQEELNPGSTIQAYSTMVKFAPRLSTDPNVVTSFLREASQSEGGINPLTVQQLAKTESAINQIYGPSGGGGKGR